MSTTLIKALVALLALTTLSIHEAPANDQRPITHQSSTAA